MVSHIGLKSFWVNNLWIKSSFYLIFYFVPFLFSCFCSHLKESVCVCVWTKGIHFFIFSKIFTDLPLSESHDSPSTSYESLRRVIHTVVQQVLKLPEFYNQSDVGKALPAHFEHQKYEDLLATAILNKVIWRVHRITATPSSCDIISTNYAPTTASGHYPISTPQIKVDYHCSFIIRKIKPLTWSRPSMTTFANIHSHNYGLSNIISKRMHSKIHWHQQNITLAPLSCRRQWQS